MPGNKISLVVATEPKRRSVRLSAKPVSAKLEMKPKRVAGKDKSSDKKVQTKGKGEQKENMPQWLTKRLKKLYLKETGN